MRFDVKLHVKPPQLPHAIGIGWQGDYPSVWDAVQAAMERAERIGGDVRGVTAMRSVTVGWSCPDCGRENPASGVSCDGCGKRAP